MPTEDPAERARALADRAAEDPEDVDRDAIVSFLERESSIARREAIRAFRTVAWPSSSFEDVVPALRDTLGADDPLTRNAALQALKDIASRDHSVVEPVLPAIAAALDDDQGLVRDSAVACLFTVAIDEPDAVEPYVSDLLDVFDAGAESGPRSPLFAIAAVARHHPETVVGAVDRFVDVLCAAPVETIGDTGGIDHRLDIERVRDVADGAKQGRRKRRAVAGTVLLAVARERPDAVVPRLETVAETLSDPVPGIRTIGIDVLGVLAADHPDRVTTYLSELGDALEAAPSVSGRATVALGALSQSRPDAVVDAIEPRADAIRERLADDDPAVRSAAAGLLSYLAEEQPEAVRPALSTVRSLLEDEHAFVRGNAIWLLAEIGTADDRAALADMVESDPAPSVQEAARAALEEL